jgi:hypothetical protein
LGKFYVEVTASARVFAALAVDADNSEDAKQKALEQVAKNGDDLRWIQTGIAGNSLEAGRPEFLDSSDPTEFMRRVMVSSINANPALRATLEKHYGQVWDTEELKRDFDVHGFLAPFCHVTRKSDKKQGSLTFQHAPRFYWGFVAEDDNGPRP